MADGEPAIFARGRVRNWIVRRIFPWSVSVTTAGADDCMAGAWACSAALRNIQVEVAIVLDDLWAFKAGAFYAHVCGQWPRVKDHALRCFYGEAVGIELGHLPAGKVEKAAAVFSDMRRVDVANAEVDGLAPWAGGSGSVRDVNLAGGGEIDVELALILAEVWRPHSAVVLMQRGSNGLPVDEVARVPDKQAGCVVKAGVGQVELVAHAQRTAVRMIAAQDGVAVSGALRKSEP